MANNEIIIGAPTDEELKHYGRKGMKWGQSIFGKKLSSLKKRKSDSDSDDGEPENKPKPPAKKSVKDMSNDELRAAIKRLEDEARYKTMQSDSRSKAAKFTSTIAKDVIKPAMINAGRNALQNSLQNLAETKIKDAMGLNTKSDLDVLKSKNDRMRAEKDYIELTEFLEKNKNKK